MLKQEVIETEKELTSREKLELMEKEMTVSWDEINEIFYHYSSSGQRTDVRAYYGHSWAKAKFPLFQKFGNKLKLSKEVENTLSSKDIRDSLRDTVLYKCRNLGMDKKEKLILELFLCSFSDQELRQNRFGEDKLILGENFQAGGKISKALKRVLKNRKLVEQIQILLSQFNEELQVKGILEISIDPIDILMMSQNATRDWTSCHNIFEGCYGAGPISYLLDGSTAIAQIIYGKSVQKDLIAQRHLIPDKIWRRMLMFDTNLDAVLVSRSYPSSNKNNTATFMNLMRETFGDIATGFLDGHQARRMIENRSSIHYNDITEGALSKVPMIVFDREKFDITEKDNSEMIFRGKISNLEDLSFVVGVSEVISPTGDFYINGDVEPDGVFDEYANEDDYYDEDEDDDYYD